MENERVKIIVDKLIKEYPHARTELDYRTPLQMLVATILSAQCTDERVNKVTKSLFKKYRSAEDYMNVPREELEEDIRPTGFFRNKAKSVQGAARMLVEKFNGKVPDTMEELLQLPGVARKTANVVLSNAFGKAEGIAVDTHVIRVSGRLGLTKEENPDRIEKDLMKLIPKDKWIDINHSLILHGRRVCKARKPLCRQCVVGDYCPSRDKFI
ncbi:MAG: endonuclease III [Chloroflexi bacterium]|nr:endonuclease III [Chloroflexota bacterium]